MQLEGRLQSSTAAQLIPGKAQHDCGKWCAEIGTMLRCTSMPFDGILCMAALKDVVYGMSANVHAYMSAASNAYDVHTGYC